MVTPMSIFTDCPLACSGALQAARGWLEPPEAQLGMEVTGGEKAGGVGENLVVVLNVQFLFSQTGVCVYDDARPFQVGKGGLRTS